MSKKRPNLVFVLIDQLRLQSLPLFGENQIKTPHIDKLATDGVVFNNAISTCPVCTPYRAMLLTGKYPQTTGMVVNSLKIRHSEISFADVCNNHGYETAWIGKWHLHTGGWPANNVPDWVPNDRSRLGFSYWRAYNQHMVYKNGFINGKDWDFECWDGFETEGLRNYAFEFLEEKKESPFCMFISPQPPHWAPSEYFPDEEAYSNIPDAPELLPNISGNIDVHRQEYRHYLAMIQLVDDMVGDLRKKLDELNLTKDTIFVFTSDHGSQMGSQGEDAWEKQLPYAESMRVPLIAYQPDVLERSSCDGMVSPVDFLPTLCSLMGLPVPRTHEGMDLSDMWLGKESATRRESALTMNFGGHTDIFRDGKEWRGVISDRYNYAKWLDGREILFDRENDVYEQNNLVDSPQHAEILSEMRSKLDALLKERNDELQPCTNYAKRVDTQRRIIENCWGTLAHPESSPDWGLLNGDYR